jgi:N-acetylglucosaminyldiphosphoundecaprenol N-acetyl-beta-D-mannosaminyltransferase
MKEIKAFGIKIHPLYKSEFLSIIESGLEKKGKLIQIGVNSASINEIVRNEKLSEAINNADLINIDGISVVWALRLMGHKIPERVATPDLANDVLAMAEDKGFSVFLFGARETVILSCKEKLLETFPNLKISGCRNGYYQPEEESSIVELINRVQPDILLIGMPSPQKELFFQSYKNQLSSNYILGVGGYFDIIAGITKRAPVWMQKIGMEWFFRFLQEPVRLFRRYLLGNAQFVWLVIREMVVKRK